MSLSHVMLSDTAKPCELVASVNENCATRELDKTVSLYWVQFGTISH